MELLKSDSKIEIEKKKHSFLVKKYLIISSLSMVIVISSKLDQGQLWLRRESGLSLCKTLNPKLLPMVASTLHGSCCHRCECVRD